jgi:hypothetical protein
MYGGDDQLAGVMTRHRVWGTPGTQDDDLFMGMTVGDPPIPQVALSTNPGDPSEVSDIAEFESGGTDSSNRLLAANNRQYHVLTWQGPGDPPLFPDQNPGNHNDGAGTLETPTFPDGTGPSGDEIWLYLGFRKDAYQTWTMGGACNWSDFEYWKIDFVRAWFDVGDVEPPDPVPDYNAAALVYEDPVEGWIPLPEQALEGETYPVCLEVHVLPDDQSHPPPDGVTVDIGTQCGDDPAVFSESFQTQFATGSFDPGVSVHCAIDGSQPFELLIEDLEEPPSCDLLMHAIQGCIPVDQDDTPGNNCRTTTIEPLTEPCPVPVVDLP